ncbi:MAG: DciA family protein [Pseudomonadota bacterium]
MKRHPDLRSEASQDPLLEAMARAKLRKQRGKAVWHPKPQLGVQARKILRQHAKKGGGSSLKKLQLNWSDLVGAELADICSPIKLTGAKTGRTLTLRVIPAAAPLIQHQEEALRQRLSVAAGGNITRLKLEHGNMPGSVPKTGKQKRILLADEEASLQRSIENIQSPRLKAAIVALGRAVLADDT